MKNFWNNIRFETKQGNWYFLDEYRKCFINSSGPENSFPCTAKNRMEVAMHIYNNF